MTEQQEFQILPPEKGSKTGESRIKLGNTIYEYGDDVNHIRKELEAIPEFNKKCVIWCGFMTPNGIDECPMWCGSCQHVNKGVLHVD